MIKAVIFDMDGLIIDSEPLWEKAFKAAFKTVDVKITAQDMREVRGRRQIESIGYLFRKHKIKGKKVEDIKELIIDDMIKLIKKEVKLLPGVKKTFQVCRKAGLPLAIASSSTSEIIDTVVDKLEIGQYFEHIYSAEYEPYGKPHPGTFLTAAKKLGVKPEDVLVFEDAPGGVLAAKSAKMHCIAVPEEAVKDDAYIKTADIILDSLEEFDEKTLAKF